MQAINITTIARHLISAVALAAAVGGAQAASAVVLPADHHGGAARIAQRDPFTDGARADARDPFTDGARIGAHDVFTDGARNAEAAATVARISNRDGYVPDASHSDTALAAA
ncbi:hypothetical protein [Cupriavidus sp. IDO]|uniref:hypothetical protein n=1 Tax=Cupriavidus sp. IDO TaxID=1539142 RepID=UPI000691A8E5|nr:hypothetical protein [Cupriavidus sp. IDO]KWR76397.1 hypothetical protein RM96_33355 [Cupriavidus sp. IDO]